MPSIPRILHKQMFRSRLSLPPSHVHFPHPALLHAICAVAARYSAAVKIDSVAESIARYNAGFETPEDDIAAISCFAERNTRYAISEMKRAGMLKGRKFFEMLQAQVSGTTACMTLAHLGSFLCATTFNNQPSEQRSWTQPSEIDLTPLDGSMVGSALAAWHAPAFPWA